MPFRPTQSRNYLGINSNSNRNSNWRSGPQHSHESHCLNGCIELSTMQGEIVWYLPSTRGYIAAIPDLRCDFVVVLQTPNLTAEDANAQDLYQCAIVSTPRLLTDAPNISQITTSIFSPRRVYRSIGPWTNPTARTHLMTTHVGFTSPRTPWHFRDRSSVQLAAPVAIPRCCLHRLPWRPNIRVQLIHDDFERLMREISEQTRWGGNDILRTTSS